MSQQQPFAFAPTFMQFPQPLGSQLQICCLAGVISLKPGVISTFSPRGEVCACEPVYTQEKTHYFAPPPRVSTRSVPDVKVSFWYGTKVRGFRVWTFLTQLRMRQTHSLMNSTKKEGTGHDAPLDLPRVSARKN